MWGVWFGLERKNEMRRWEDEDHRGEEREGETDRREGWWDRFKSSYGGGGLGSCRGGGGVWLVGGEVEWEDEGEEELRKKREKINK